MTEGRVMEMPEKIYVQVHTKSHYWSIYPLKTVEYVEYTRAPQWQDISSAPRDGTPILVFAPSRDGLPDLMAVSKYHPDAGFCIDEIRFETHWHPLPAPPEVGS